MSSVEHAKMSSTSSCDESPKSTKMNSSSSKPVKGGNDTTRFAGCGVDFKGKLIGAEDVAEPRGDKMCQIAMAKLKAGVKASHEHKLPIIVNISLDGIKIVDDKSAEVLHVHEVNRISFISRDTGDSRAFGYVYRRNDSSHQFFGIKTEKAAEALVLSLRDMFQAVFEKKKRDEAETSSTNTSGADSEPPGAAVKQESMEQRATENSQAKSKDDKSATAENLLNFEVEFQNMAKGSVPPISPLWTTVDPWKQSGPLSVGVTGLPVMGSTQPYQNTAAMVISPFGLPAANMVHQTHQSPFSGAAWPLPPQQQQVATPLSAPPHPNGNVARPTDTPGHVIAGPSPGNPFLTAVTPAASNTSDPFAKLASGLLDATPQSHHPRKKMNKSEFFPEEPPKPSLMHLSQQQQQQQRVLSDTDREKQAEQQTNVDLFGATPFSTAMTPAGPVNDPFARIE